MIQAGISIDAKRDKDAARQDKKRASDRDLRISRVKEPNRRRDCLADVYLFLKTYFPGVFYQPFTADRREMVDAIMHAARYGGDQAVAGPRADGKTRSALYGTLQLVLSGAVPFPMIISKSGPRAARELKNMKQAIQASILLAEDFPEVLEPVLALGRWSSRARQQTVYGKYTNLEWGEECIIFPDIPSKLLWDNGWNPEFESAAREQIVASLGIEGPIRGYSVRDRRPTLALLDDIDDRESARSELQTGTREQIIEEDVGGLAGPDTTIARVMLCTLLNLTCNAAVFTDRSKKPSWRGQRHRLLNTKPDNEDLWEQYMQLRQGRAEADPDARVAHAFYLAHREAMDAGAIVTNPYRFDGRLLLDEQPSEASALQACYNLIADRGLEHFNTEYQNDPPEVMGPVESGITPKRIQEQVSGYARKVIPTGCIKLTAGIDVGKYYLHWVVRAWRADGTGFTIDYGHHDVIGTSKGTEDGLDVAIKRAIFSLVDAIKTADYAQADGEVQFVNRILIDAGWRTQAIYSACSSLAGNRPGNGLWQVRTAVQSPASPTNSAAPRIASRATAGFSPGRPEISGLSAPKPTAGKRGSTIGG
jgi:hypothetical protein